MRNADGASLRAVALCIKLPEPLQLIANRHLPMLHTVLQYL